MQMLFHLLLPPKFLKLFSFFFFFSFCCCLGEFHCFVFCLLIPSSSSSSLLLNPPLVHFSRRRQWHPTPVLLPGKSHGQRSLVGAVHEVAKSWTQLSDFTFTFHFHALEKEMATHSSVLAWRLPGTGEPGGLLSTGSHRVGHD